MSGQLVKFSLSTNESFSAVTRARSKSHPNPNTKCVTILYKYQISEVKSSQTHFWVPPCISRQLLVRVVNRTHYSWYGMCHDSLHIWDQWVKSSQTHFWAPPSLLSAVWLVRVVKRTVLLIMGVSRFCVNVRSVSQTLTHSLALVSTTKSFLVVTRASDRTHTTPNTGCVKILYKCHVTWLNSHTWAWTRLSRQTHNS